MGHFLLVYLLLTAASLTGKGSEESKADLLHLAEFSTAEAVRIRGLAPTSPVRSKVTSKAEVRSYVLQRFKETEAAKMIGHQEELLRLIELPDLKPDLAGALTRVLEEQIAGYYDWESETLFVANWLQKELQGPTLIHEVTHALQDQHFGLGQFMDPIHQAGEAQVAIQAVVEGDATFVMFLSMLPPGMGENIPEAAFSMMDQVSRAQMANDPSLKEVPRIIRDSLMFPYINGLRFVRAVHKKGGWEAVNKLYKAPPLTSEQILHPQKFLQQEKEPAVELVFRTPPFLKKAGWAWVTSSPWGEMGLVSLLRSYVAEDPASRAAAGWNGDRALLLTRPGRGKAKAPSYALVWVMDWDSPQDLEEATQTLSDAMESVKAATLLSIPHKQRLVGYWGPTLSPEDKKSLTQWGQSDGIERRTMNSFADYQALGKQLDKEIP